MRVALASCIMFLSTCLTHFCSFPLRKKLAAIDATVIEAVPFLFTGVI